MKRIYVVVLTKGDAIAVYSGLHESDQVARIAAKLETPSHDIFSSGVLSDALVIDAASELTSKSL